MIRLLAKQGVGLLFGATMTLAVVLAVPTAAARWMDAPAASPAAVGVTVAPVAPVLHYQGRLLDPTTGQAKADGPYPVVFRLYGTASGGSPLWTESKSITVSRGLFATLLGDTTALDLAHFDGRELYLGVTVGSDPEAQPRQRIAFVAYALYAANADTLAGKSAAEFAAASHSHDGGAITSGIILEARIDPAIARDSEIVPAVAASGQFAPAAHSHTGADIQDGSITTAKLAGAGASAGQVLSYDGANVSWSTLPDDGLLRVTTLNVTCTSIASITTTYQKLADIGSFNKVAADSVVEVSFHGRIAVNSMAGTGAVFELRINDAATSTGRVRAVIKQAEQGLSGINASMNGVFTNLAAGTHTVSIWVQGANGSGTSAYVDPGCWSADQIVIKELR